MSVVRGCGAAADHLLWVCAPVELVGLVHGGIVVSDNWRLLVAHRLHAGQTIRVERSAVDGGHQMLHWPDFARASLLISRTGLGQSLRELKEERVGLLFAAAAAAAGRSKLAGSEARLSVVGRLVGLELAHQLIEAIRGGWA